MVKLKLLLILMLVLIVSGSITGQTAIWTAFGIEKQVKKWSFGAETEYRTQSNLANFQRWSLKTEVSYKLIKPLKLGAGYEHILYNDEEYNDLQPRHRYFAFMQLKQKIGDFTFSSRQQGQRTIKDESDRLKSNGEYDTYKNNPDWYWRTKFKIAYNIPRFPVNPSVSFESYYHLSKTEDNSFTSLRYTLAFDYNINKKNSIALFGLLKRNLAISSNTSDYIIGLNYLYSF